MAVDYVVEPGLDDRRRAKSRCGRRGWVSVRSTPDESLVVVSGAVVERGKDPEVPGRRGAHAIAGVLALTGADHARAGCG
ncbi:hypothetical protein [Dactylosporangium sp. CA-092794]|uniref:hypothetical protein n=1 Tax=Dactylosporangium sp. CA-092794 TaxID=3239929 RepID=UPI003D8DFD1E